MAIKAKKKALEPYLWQELKPYPIIGVDEVGRGCLAGPVYAAAVILPEGYELKGLTDSKKLSAVQRKKLSQQIYQDCKVSLGFASVDEIDQINILQASLLAMKRAVEGFELIRAHVIVDGNQKIPGLQLTQTTIIQGDSRALPIAAASVVAKVYRDELMFELGQKYNGYGLQEHKGYATLQHKESIKNLGPTEIHRKSFAGVKEHVREGLLVSAKGQEL